MFLVWVDHWNSHLNWYINTVCYQNFKKVTKVTILKQTSPVTIFQLLEKSGKTSRKCEEYYTNHYGHEPNHLTC